MNHRGLEEIKAQLKTTLLSSVLLLRDKVTAPKTKPWKYLAQSSHSPPLYPHLANVLTARMVTNRNPTIDLLM